MDENLNEQIIEEEEEAPEDSNPPEEKKKQSQNTPYTDAIEESGALDLLADTLLTMYTNPKIPPEVFSFFLTTAQAIEHPDVEKLLTENQELRKSIISLKAQVAELESRARK